MAERRIEAELPRVPPPPVPPDDSGVVQDDLAAILRELGLGDHARPISPHEAVQTLVLPAISRLRDDRGRLRAEVDTAWQAAGDMAAIEEAAAKDRAETVRLRAELAVLRLAIGPGIPTDAAHEAEHQRMDEQFRQAREGGRIMTERWRVGTKIGKNLYRITDEHPEGEDIGRMDTPELAAVVVEAVNRLLDTGWQWRYAVRAEWPDGVKEFQAFPSRQAAEQALSEVKLRERNGQRPEATATLLTLVPVEEVPGDG